MTLLRGQHGELATRAVGSADDTFEEHAEVIGQPHDAVAIEQIGAGTDLARTGHLRQRRRLSARSIPAVPRCTRSSWAPASRASTVAPGASNNWNET